MAPDRAEVLAVLDWELSTLGHPLGDLAYMCMPYRMPAGTPGLRREDEVVVGPRLVPTGKHPIEGELLVGPVDQQGARVGVQRVAGALARSDGPVLEEEVVQVPELLAERVRVGPAQLHGLEVHLRGRVRLPGQE